MNKLSLSSDLKQFLKFEMENVLRCSTHVRDHQGVSHPIPEIRERHERANLVLGKLKRLEKAQVSKSENG